MGLMRTASGSSHDRRVPWPLPHAQDIGHAPDSRNFRGTEPVLTMERLARENDLSQIQSKGHEDAQLESTQ